MHSFQCHWLVESEPTHVGAHTPQEAAAKFAEEYGCNEIVATVRHSEFGLTRWRVRKHQSTLGLSTPTVVYLADPILDEVQT
jgi:hypothetical protein